MGHTIWANVKKISSLFCKIRDSAEHINQKGALLAGQIAGTYRVVGLSQTKD